MSDNKREFKGNSVISMPDEFTIIDIETTGLYTEWDDIIEVSAIRYNKEFEEIGRFSELIQPPCENPESGEFISDFISYLTGITNEMLVDADVIENVLPRYLDFIGDSFIIGYNVNFDINFIYDNAEYLELNHFSNDFMDIMRLSRKIHKEMQHHRLKDMAELYDIDYTNAHRSLADCLITKEVFKNLLIEGIDIFGSFEDISKAFHSKNKKGSSRLKAEDFISQVNPDEIDSENPIYGKTIVFTGALERMERKYAFQIVTNLGGIPADGVTKKTNLLVLGNNDYCKTIKDGKSSKQKKAEQYKLDGLDIDIIPETVFYEMVETSN